MLSPQFQDDAKNLRQGAEERESRRNRIQISRNRIYAFYFREKRRVMGTSEEWRPAGQRGPPLSPLRARPGVRPGWKRGDVDVLQLGLLQIGYAEVI